MQTYDLVMIAVVAGAVLFGYWRGLAWQIASLASIIVSYIVARNFADVLAMRISVDPAWNKFLAMFILFFGTSLLIWIGFGFVKNTIERWHLKTFDRQAGAALGAVKGGLLCIIITLFGVSLLGENVCRAICTSRSGNYVAQALARLGGIVPEEVNTYIRPYVERLREELDSHEGEVPETGDDDGLNLPLWNNGPPAQSTGFSNQAATTGTGTAPANSTGVLYPAGPGTTNSWEGEVQRIDLGRVAGQIVEQVINGQRN